MNSKTSEIQAKIKFMQKTEGDFASEIHYIFQNHKRSDFSLPKKSICGKKLIPPGGTFKGEEYFMTFVKTGDIRLIDIIHPPVNKINEATGVKMEKLILDQPDTYTQEGKTESVVKETKTQVLNDNNSNEQKYILLTENPMEGIEIIKS